MPGINIIKYYDDHGCYHVYNRGVEKRAIYLDHQDYVVFLSYLRDYLSNIIDITEKSFPSRKLKNYSEEIHLLSYCLMPNHFHLHIRQFSRMAMASFMRSLLTRYSMYFNRKYHRVGCLFQSRYKAAPITSDEQQVYLTRYIHRNPVAEATNDSEADLDILKGYRYSSLENYLGMIDQPWVKCGEVLKLFGLLEPGSNYAHFVSNGVTSGSVLEVEMRDEMD